MVWNSVRTVPYWILRQSLNVCAGPRSRVIPDGRYSQWKHTAHFVLRQNRGRRTDGESWKENGAIGEKYPIYYDRLDSKGRQWFQEHLWVSLLHCENVNGGQRNREDDSRIDMLKLDVFSWFVRWMDGFVMILLWPYCQKWRNRAMLCNGYFLFLWSQSSNRDMKKPKKMHSIRIFRKLISSWNIK